jgi:hypothetical protein
MQLCRTSNCSNLRRSLRGRVSGWCSLLLSCRHNNTEAGGLCQLYDRPRPSPTFPLACMHREVPAPSSLDRRGGQSLQSTLKMNRAGMAQMLLAWAAVLATYCQLTHGHKDFQAHVHMQRSQVRTCRCGTCTCTCKGRAPHPPVGAVGVGAGSSIVHWWGVDDIRLLLCAYTIVARPIAGPSGDPCGVAGHWLAGLEVGAG